MNKIKQIALALLGALAFTSCIDNTIPYPVVEIDILEYGGEGFRAAIDPTTRTVTLTLDEETDITQVKVTEARITEEGSSSIPLVGTFDLRQPLAVTLSLYQDYYWTIRAEQPIERYFTVAGQIGQSVIDTESRTATAYVAEGSNLKDVKITSLKLGPRGVTTMSPSIEELTTFESVRYVYLQYPALKGAQERWQLYVLETGVKVNLTAADAWATMAWLYGAAEAGTTVGFRYRKVGEE
ncbi:MAG: hypothetical protein II228_03920, partial [Alistipes sp.]|nr:hypothetical protein [Alistipes sp.]